MRIGGVGLMAGCWRKASNRRHRERADWSIMGYGIGLVLGGLMQRIIFQAMQKDRQAEWGDQSCNHPSIVQESHLGRATEAFACSVCGRDLTPDGKTLPI